jgi:hypothetical protein
MTTDLDQMRKNIRGTPVEIAVRALEVASVVTVAGLGRRVLIAAPTARAGRWLWSWNGLNFIRKTFVLGELPGEALLVGPPVAFRLAALLPSVGALLTVAWWAGLGTPVSFVMLDQIPRAIFDLPRFSVEPITLETAPGSDALLEITTKDGNDRVLVVKILGVDP